MAWSDKCLVSLLFHLNTTYVYFLALTLIQYLKFTFHYFLKGQHHSLLSKACSLSIAPYSTLFRFTFCELLSSNPLASFITHLSAYHVVTLAFFYTVIKSASIKHHTKIACYWCDFVEIKL